ncbi:MAG TPA: hypothetical protein VIE13_06275 [Terriglobales bacterium]|jgi:hypothetical protein
MKQPGGVVAVAVLDFVGSGLLVAMTGLMMLGAVGQLAAGARPGAPTPAYRAGQMMAVSLLYLLPAAWGILTAIGLLRMRLWSIASTVVFAYLLVCAAAGMVIAAVWTPIPAPNPQFELLMRLVMGAAALVVAAIGVWWLVYFSRRPVRAQFSASGGWARRPLSISLLGWVGVIAACGCAVGALIPHPFLTFFGWPVSGAPARVVFLLIAAVQMAVGWGLLRLKSWAGNAALALYGLTVANSLATWLVPRGLEQAVARASAANPALTNSSAHAMLFAFSFIGSVSGVITGLICLYFLWTRREAFHPPPPLPPVEAEQAANFPVLVAQEAGAGEPLPPSAPVESGEDPGGNETVPTA